MASLDAGEPLEASRKTPAESASQNATRIPSFPRMAPSPAAAPGLESFALPQQPGADRRTPLYSRGRPGKRLFTRWRQPPGCAISRRTDPRQSWRHRANRSVRAGSAAARRWSHQIPGVPGFGNHASVQVGNPRRGPGSLAMHTHSTEPWRHSHRFLGEKHEQHERRTWFVVGLTAAMMVIEIIGGTIFGSMALLADGWHMSTHAGALAIAAFAYRFARRHARDPRFAFGTGKLGDLAGFASAIVLALIALAIGYESA